MINNFKKYISFMLYLTRFLIQYYFIFFKKKKIKIINENKKLKTHFQKSRHLF